jgi:hypothetical protein
VSALLPLPLAAPAPIDWSPELAFAVPASFSEMAGKGRARDAVKARWLRPADLDRAVVAPPQRLWIPVWRVEGAVDGFHVGLERSGAKGGRILPTGGYRHHDGVVLVPARRGFPIDVCERTTLTGQPAAAMARGDLRAFGAVAPPEDELVQPDVSGRDAESEATLRFRRQGEPQRALYASVDVKIRASDLVFHPVWAVRYLYAGEASEGTESEYYAAISAHTGELVGERHPSVFGSIKSRLKSWL